MAPERCMSVRLFTVRYESGGGPSASTILIPFLVLALSIRRGGRADPSLVDVYIPSGWCTRLMATREFLI